MANDEDEVLEVRSGAGSIRELPVGLWYAKCRNLSHYLAGNISAEEFEAELERLLQKG